MGIRVAMPPPKREAGSEGLGSTFGAIGGMIGGVAGGIYGGPTGAMAGYSSGSAIGSTVGGALSPGSAPSVGEQVQGAETGAGQDAMARRMQAMNESPYGQIAKGIDSLQYINDPAVKEQLAKPLLQAEYLARQKQQQGV